MDELLGAILEAIAGALLEAFLELIAAAILELATTVLLTLLRSSAEMIKESRIFATFTYAFLGVLAGALSLLVLPHSLVHRKHGISLLISPIIAGIVLSQVGSLMRRWGKQTTPLETFSYGFAFALGIAVVRFFFSK